MVGAARMRPLQPTLKPQQGRFAMLKIKRVDKGNNSPHRYHFLLITVRGNTVAVAYGNSPIAPAWLRHQQALANTRLVLG